MFMALRQLSAAMETIHARYWKTSSPAATMLQTSSSNAEGNLGYYRLPPSLDLRPAFYPCNISSKETDNR
jgi:hypothetical protein